jgi:hypothetical protein
MGANKVTVEDPSAESDDAVAKESGVLFGGTEEDSGAGAGAGAEAAGVSVGMAGSSASASSSGPSANDILDVASEWEKDTDIMLHRKPKAVLGFTASDVQSFFGRAAKKRRLSKAGTHEPGAWACLKCTFMNEPSGLSGGMVCGALPPLAAKPP